MLSCFASIFLLVWSLGPDAGPVIRLWTLPELQPAFLQRLKQELNSAHFSVPQTPGMVQTQHRDFQMLTLVLAASSSVPASPLNTPPKYLSIYLFKQMPHSQRTEIGFNYIVLPGMGMHTDWMKACAR